MFADVNRVVIYVVVIPGTGPQLSMAALRSRCGHFIFALWFLLSCIFFPRLISAVADGCLPFFHTWCGLSANLGCRSEKNLLNSNISPTCPYSMTNFGPLTADISIPVWGTPAKFNGCLGSVTARHSSSGRQPNFAALNRGRHLYSAGRPSRWAVAHILVVLCFFQLVVIVRRPNTRHCVYVWLQYCIDCVLKPSISHLFPIIRG